MCERQSEIIGKVLTFAFALETREIACVPNACHSKFVRIKCRLCLGLLWNAAQTCCIKSYGSKGTVRQHFRINGPADQSSQFDQHSSKILQTLARFLWKSSVGFELIQFRSNIA